MSQNRAILKAQLKDAADAANGLWERFAVFLHAHPKSACLVMLAAGLWIGSVFL